MRNVTFHFFFEVERKAHEESREGCKYKSGAYRSGVESLGDLGVRAEEHAAYRTKNKIIFGHRMS
jgi:hypothetical protein